MAHRNTVAVVALRALIQILVNIDISTFMSRPNIAMASLRRKDSNIIPSAAGTPAPEDPRLLASSTVIPAIDPLTLAITECMSMLLAMRKVARYQYSGVAAILGGADFFGNQDDEVSSNLQLLARNNGPNLPKGMSNANPLVLSFLQLRSILSEAKHIHQVDSLTILQPFLLIIKLPLTSGQITAMALDAISKFLAYGVLTGASPNLTSTLIQICIALTHCRFEAADQSGDDAVLLKVLRLMETVVTCPFSLLLSNDVILEVVQTCLSLACNKKRSEVLRRAAEMAIGNITARLFSQLKDFSPAQSLEGVVVDTILPADVIGSGVDDISQGDINPDAPVAVETTQDEKTDTDTTEVDTTEADTEVAEGFDVSCLHEFTSILISMISPSNQYQHMESTRVLALRLLNIAVEVSGDSIPTHSSLMSLFADPVSKHVLLIITTSESPALLESAWRLFTAMTVLMGSRLKSQIELTFSLIFSTASSPAPNGNKDVVANAAKPAPAPASAFSTPAAKEMILESLSLLWTRDPRFFTRLYADFDCDFDRIDLARQLVEFLCKLALPELALVSSDNVPPLCLEGLLAFVNGVNSRVKVSEHLNSSESPAIPKRLANKVNKNAFVECTDAFNKKPKDGIAALHGHGFISNPDDVGEVAEFIFSKLGRLNKKVIGEFLAKADNKEILKHFISLFNYKDLRVDEAIRLLLKTFRLPGEAQQIERIVEIFAERYAECQANAEGPQEEKSEEQELALSVCPDKDSVFILSYSIILLNTDLHNPQVKKQMTLDAYMKNLRGTYNGGDYPEWYLGKIYSSIRDREIIMPEEHHGTEKWFDDTWHNVVSAEASKHNEFVIEDSEDIAIYDKHVFSETVDQITECLVNIFNEASDDHIITRLMSSIDRSVNICLHFGIHSSVDKLIGLLADLTTLTDPSRLRRATEETDDNLRDEIPITQIKLDSKDEAITVSDTAVWFGRDFKAQLSTVVLFRLLKKTKCHVTPGWEKVLQIILTLFQCCLVDPNIYTEFQTSLSLSPLLKAKPRYIINRAKPLKDGGLLLTFSSFLKGYSDEPPEPTDLEVESTLSTIDCVKSLNLSSIFGGVAEGTIEDKKSLCKMFLALLPDKHDDSLKRYYELQVLFALELVVSLALLVNDEQLFKDSLAKITAVKSQLSKKGELRLVIYELILWRQVGVVEVSPNEESSIKGPESSFEWILSLEKDVLTKNGLPVLQPLFALADFESPFYKDLVVSELFWKVLRTLGSIPIFSSKVLSFVKSLIKTSSNDITVRNFMLVLGLLDEISSVGALAAQWEQETDKMPSPPNNRDSEYLRELVDSSRSSIEVTSELSSLINDDGFTPDNAGYPLVQALAHQCFNPCREVRAHAINSLKKTVLHVAEHHDDKLPPSGAFHFGLFPLLGELAKPSVVQTDPSGFATTQVEALSLCSKVFLQFIDSLGDEFEGVWFGILEGFKSFSDIRNSGAPDNTGMRESGAELMKNMLLVLQSGGRLVPETQFWTRTWAIAGELYGLQPESQKPLPGNTEPETPEPEIAEKEPVLEKTQELRSEEAKETEKKDSPQDKGPEGTQERSLQDEPTTNEENVDLVD